jgi:hypothetical protein
MTAIGAKLSTAGGFVDGKRGWKGGTPDLPGL